MNVESCFVVLLFNKEARDVTGVNVTWLRGTGVTVTSNEHRF